MKQGPVLLGARVRLSPFGAGRITQRYLDWLSDPVVNEYSRRRDLTPATPEDAIQYLAQLRPDENVLAIDTTTHGHIGNLKYGPIDRVNKRCDIAIMLGEKAAWGQGYGAEAVYLLSRWLFEAEGLVRVDAGSANPAFLRLVEKLGWRIEVVQPAHVQIGGQKLDWSRVALAATDFLRRPEFDCREEECFVAT